MTETAGDVDARLAASVRQLVLHSAAVKATFEAMAEAMYGNWRLCGDCAPLGVNLCEACTWELPALKSAAGASDAVGASTTPAIQVDASDAEPEPDALEAETSGGEQVRRKSILKTASSTSSMRSLSWAPDIPPDKPPTVRVAPENVWAVGLPKCPGDGFVPGYDEGDVTPGRDKALWMVGDHGLQKTVVEGYSWSCAKCAVDGEPKLKSGATMYWCACAGCDQRGTYCVCNKCYKKELKDRNTVTLDRSDGKSLGFGLAKMKGGEGAKIKPGSIAGQSAEYPDIIRNGRQLKAINGNDVTSSDAKMIGALIRASDTVEIEFVFINALAGM